MVSNITSEDIQEVNNLGIQINPNFCKLFHIDNLNQNEKIYVYKDNNKVIGFIHISINYEIVDLLNIIVLEEYRKQNIATILMDYMITDLPKNIQKIMLEVNEENDIAIKFYHKFNFKIINTRKNYYGNKKAYIMERNF